MDDRPISRRDLRQIMIGACGVDIDNVDSLEAAADRRQWVASQKKTQETTKERRIASMAGIGYGIIGTVATAGLSWLTGVGQWLLNTLTSRH